LKISRVLAIIPAYKSYPFETIESLKNQTVENDIIVTASPKMRDDMTYYISLGVDVIFDNSKISEPKGIRVVKALNNALDMVGTSLKDYDYILKIDSDMILQSNFLEYNIARNKDLMGMGRCLLIKVSKFIEVTDGRFYEKCSCDDTYLFAQFQAANADMIKWNWYYAPYEPIKHIAKCTQRELFITGFDAGRIGIRLSIKNIWIKPVQFIGYILGILYPFKFPVYYKLRKVRRLKNAL